MLPRLATVGWGGQEGEAEEGPGSRGTASGEWRQAETMMEGESSEVCGASVGMTRVGLPGALRKQQSTEGRAS